MMQHCVCGVVRYMLVCLAVHDTGVLGVAGGVQQWCDQPTQTNKHVKQNKRVKQMMIWYACVSNDNRWKNNNRIKKSAGSAQEGWPPDLRRSKIK